MPSKGFKMRAQLYAQIGAMGLATPVMLYFSAWAVHATIVWSYGGQDEFDRLVLQEPLDNEWVKADPTIALGRKAPLSAVPDQITAMPAGDKTATRTHKDF